MRILWKYSSLLLFLPLYLQATEPPKPTYEQLIQSYLQYFEQNLPDSAELVLVEALRLYPQHEGNFILRGNLAELQVARGDTVAALQELSKAIGEQPEVTQLRSRRAELYEERREWTQALVDLDELIRQQPTWEIPLYNRARVRYKLHLYGGAKADLEEIMKLNPTAYLPRIALAKVLEADEETLEAEKLLTHLVDKYPKVPNAYRVLARLLLRQNRKSEALDKVRYVINELKVAEAEDYLLRGSIWYRYGEKEQAELDYQKAKKMGATEHRIKEERNEWNR